MLSIFNQNHVRNIDKMKRVAKCSVVYFLDHCMLSDGTQRRALSCYQSEEKKIIRSFKLEREPTAPLRHDGVNDATF